MGTRLQLHAILKNITENVYHQPPPDMQMQYPCIVYKRDRIKFIYSSDRPYKWTRRYMVTVIDRDPDSVLTDQVAALPMCVFNRFFTADKLNHDVFNIYF